MEGQEDREGQPLLKKERNVTTILANSNRVKSAWVNFMNEFKSAFYLDELDQVFSQLKLLDGENLQNQKNEEEDDDKVSKDMDTFDDELSQLEKKVFGNHLLSKAIFNHLSIQELLPCRLVNTEWNETVTQMLSDKQLTLKFSSNIRRRNLFYLTNSSTTSTWKNLDLFMELLKSATNFSCERYEFSDGNLGNEDAQRFFTRYGSLMRYLKIYSSGDPETKRRNHGRCSSCYGCSCDGDEWCDTGFSRKPTSYDTVGNILISKANNIKELDLSMYNDLGSGFSLKEEIKLPHLTDLTFKCDSHYGEYLLTSLLKGAKNLQTIDIGEYSIKILSKFPPSRQASVVKLGTFQNYYSGRDWSVELPVFSKVQHIGLKAVNNKGSFFPKDSSISLAFPQLNSVSITLERERYRVDEITEELEENEDWLGNECSWETFFPSNEKIPTVHTVMIDKTSVCPLDSDKLLQIFPNLKKVIIFGIDSFIPFAQAVWKFRKALDILHIGKDFSCPSNYCPVLSSHSNFDELMFPSCPDLEYIWKNFVENKDFNHPMLVKVQEKWIHEPDRIELSGLQILSRTRYHFEGSSILTLTTLREEEDEESSESLQETYHILSGSILRESRTIEHSLYDYDEPEIKYLELVQVLDDVDPFIGLRIYEGEFNDLKEVLSDYATAVEEL